MSKYTCSVLVTLALSLSASCVMADEEVKSSSTRVETPDYSSSSSATTTESNPTTVKQESSYSESSPNGEKQVTTSRKYSAPAKKHTVIKNSETQVSQ